MKSIFFFLLTSVVGVWSLTDEHAEKLKKWHMQCFDETKVDPEYILKLQQGNSWHINHKTLKMWTLCLLNKYDVMTPQGVFKLDTALSLVPQRDKEMIEDLINDCLPTTAGAPYEIAWNYTKCYHIRAQDPKNKDKHYHYLTLFY